MTIIDQIMNFMFFIDIILVFFSSYLDSDYNTVDEHKVFWNY